LNPDAKTRSDEVISSLCGHEADRASALTQRTRQVVLASQGVLKDQQSRRRRTRALALTSVVFILLSVTPLIWWSVDIIIADEHFSEVTGQIALWSCTLCPALIATVLIAGWMRRQQQ
jgi:polyferredoxin